jgi:hypothetical protein
MVVRTLSNWIAGSRRSALASCVLLLVTLESASGCSQAHSIGPVDGGTESGAEPDALVEDAAVADAGTRSYAPGPATCTFECRTREDCALADHPLYDADNYVCEGGLCRWLGCGSDEECESLGPRVRCQSVRGVGVCGRRCDTPADCPPGEAGPLYDESRFACADIGASG